MNQILPLWTLLGIALCATSAHGSGGSTIPLETSEESKSLIDENVKNVDQFDHGSPARSAFSISQDGSPRREHICPTASFVGHLRAPDVKRLHKSHAALESQNQVYWKEILALRANTRNQNTHEHPITDGNVVSSESTATLPNAGKAPNDDYWKGMYLGLGIGTAAT